MGAEKLAMHFGAVLLPMFVLPSASVLAEELLYQSATRWMPFFGAGSCSGPSAYACPRPA
jgi:uncharacterized membrane protein